MKCPKCGYLGFEDVERCRNCGYEFSLMPPSSLPELPLRNRDERLAPLDDLSLVDAASATETTKREPSAASGPAGRASVDRPATGDLPLFWSAGTPDEPSRSSAVPAVPDDAPLITTPSPPRAPLSVRRATPELPRVRSAQLRTPMLDLNSFDTEQPSAGRPHERLGAEAAGESSEPAGFVARAGAALFDVLILAGIDVAVIYLTMKICGVGWAEIAIIPIAPLAAFLAAQNLGYFVGLTLGGQTLGKMLTGIRVVTVEDRTLDFGHAMARTLVWCALAIPAGLGFLTALFGDEGRGLHDRFAGSKVVRA
jgi:uncharacterized RDD family membrane protein YckC